MFHSRAFCSSRSVCSFGISIASLSINSAAVSKTGAEWANSGKTTSRTGKNGAAPATAESIIESIRSVFARIAFRSTGFGRSVWQQATEYLICSIETLPWSADILVGGSRASCPPPTIEDAGKDAGRTAGKMPALLSPKDRRIDQRNRRGDHASIVLLKISQPCCSHRKSLRRLVRVTAHAMKWER